MKNNKRLFRQYFRKIRQALPCGWRQRHSILRDIRGSVSGYLSENPNADFGEVEAHFGSAETIAASYVCNEEPSILLHSYQTRHKVLTIVAVTAAAMLLVWSAGVLIVASHETTEFPGFVEVSIEKGVSYDSPPYYH